MAKNREPVRYGIAQALRTLKTANTWWADGVRLSPDGAAWVVVNTMAVENVVGTLRMLRGQLEDVIANAERRHREGLGDEDELGDVLPPRRRATKVARAVAAKKARKAKPAAKPAKKARKATKRAKVANGHNGDAAAEVSA
jgi:peptidoglycan hydrolase CwlO-like protein